MQSDKPVFHCPFCAGENLMNVLFTHAKPEIVYLTSATGIEFGFSVKEFSCPEQMAPHRLQCVQEID